MKNNKIEKNKINVRAVVLAAGKGTRMKSDLPKVFHEICGRPMLSYVLDTVKKLGVKDICVVVGHMQDLIKDYYKDQGLYFASQKEQLGTAHAVMQVENYLSKYNGVVLVLAGDMPLIKSETLKKLIDFHVQNNAKATVLTARLDDPANFGRIVRDDKDQVQKIVEKKDASLDELKIKEVNTGVFCFDNQALFYALQQVKPENVQKEYYLTDVIEILKKNNLSVFAFQTNDSKEAIGINTKEELASVERIISS